MDGSAVKEVHLASRAATIIHIIDTFVYFFSPINEQSHLKIMKNSKRTVKKIEVFLTLSSQKQQYRHTEFV